jgi:hypothetical protein
MASLKKKITENTRRRSNMKVLMQETADWKANVTWKTQRDSTVGFRRI